MADKMETGTKMIRELTATVLSASDHSREDLLRLEGDLLSFIKDFHGAAAALEELLETVRTRSQLQ